ncbi:unnamed protein product [Protopolystoma xenopodis]|uniref:Alpha-1,3-glucosyltransferase n=1 Tax=Protopolystoma xenopodis TaxID=117903 RepID=A0A448X2Q1_9PLAT|nr:unnamed protein product [Protopolystoma xenopodis]
MNHSKLFYYYFSSHSTDFEVHRNWLAITHSLPISKWYIEITHHFLHGSSTFYLGWQLFLIHKCSSKLFLISRNLGFSIILYRHSEES